MKTSDLKANGFHLEGVKHYQIVHEGETYICAPAGQKWECRSMVDTLKNIKRAIIDGSIPEDVEIEEPQECAGTWDCIHPCAILIDRLGVEACEADKDIMDTLHSYAWCDDDRVIDTDRVERAFGRKKSVAPEQILKKEIAR